MVEALSSWNGSAWISHPGPQSANYTVATGPDRFCLYSLRITWIALNFCPIIPICGLGICSLHDDCFSSVAANAMKKYHKITLFIVAVAGALAIITMFVLDYQMRSILHKRIETNLSGLARTALIFVPDNTAKQNVAVFDSLADRLGQASHARITYIDHEGVVLGDSELSLAEVGSVESHASRPEVMQALKTGHGKSIRYSNTLKESMMYFAMSNIKEVMHSSGSSESPHIFVARASMPLASESALIVEMRFGLTVITLLSLLSLLLLWILALRILKQAIADEQSVLEQRVEDRTREISLLQNLSSLLNACKNIDEAARVIQNLVPTLLPRTLGAVFMINSSRNMCELIVFWGEKGPKNDKFDPGDCWALRKGHPYYSNENDVQILCPHSDYTLSAPTLCIPLTAQGNTLGSLHLNFRHTELTVDMRRLAMSVAEQISLALANISLRDDLFQQAIRDPLTGLYNRRYLTESTEQSINLVKRNNSGMAVVMLDADHFKRFNDTFGHEAGDIVLKRIAREIRQSTRASDIPARYGGEEFCIVYTNIVLDEAIHLAEKLRENISSLDLELDHIKLGQVTVSLGLAMYPDHADNVEQLLIMADEALYRAKGDGRNKLVVASGSR